MPLPLYTAQATSKKKAPKKGAKGLKKKGSTKRPQGKRKK